MQLEGRLRGSLKPYGIINVLASVLEFSILTPTPFEISLRAHAYKCVTSAFYNGIVTF